MMALGVPFSALPVAQHTKEYQSPSQSDRDAMHRAEEKRARKNAARLARMKR